MQVLPGFVPPVFQLSENVYEVRASRFADPLRRIMSLPGGVIEVMLVMGVGVTRIIVRVVVPKNGPIC